MCRDTLGGQFRTAWLTFLATLPANIKNTLQLPDYTPSEGEYVGFFGGSGDICLGKLLRVYNGRAFIQRAWVTPLGTLQLTDRSTFLRPNQWVLRLSFDKEGRFHGVTEHKMANPTNWEIAYTIKGRMKIKRFFLVRPKHIYKVMMKNRHTRPTCETKWPLEGLGRVTSKEWSSAHGAVPSTIGSPRDYKTHVKLLHRGLWTPHKGYMARKLPDDRCRCGFQGTHLHIFYRCMFVNPLIKAFEDLCDHLQFSGAASRGLTPKNYILGRLNGSPLPPGLLLFLFVLKKFYWIEFTSCKYGESTVFRTPVS